MKVAHKFLLVTIPFLAIMVPSKVMGANYLMSDNTSFYINEEGEHKHWTNSFPEGFTTTINNSVELTNVTMQRMWGAALTEYVPKGETLDNWTEMLTTQYYHFNRVGSITPAIEGIEPIIDAGKEICSLDGNKKGKFTLDVLSETKTEVLYKLTLKNCGDNNAADQTEYGRFVVGKYGYHNITYSIKNTVLTPEKESYAWEILKSSRLVSDNRCGDACKFKGPRKSSKAD